MDKNIKPFNCMNVMAKGNFKTNPIGVPINLQQQNIPFNSRNKSTMTLESVNNNTYFDEDSVLNFGKGKRDIKDFECLNIGVPSNSIVNPYITYDDFFSVGEKNNKKDICQVLEYNYLSLQEKINTELGVKYPFLKPTRLLGLTIYTDENLKTYLTFSAFDCICTFMKSFEPEIRIDELIENSNLAGKELINKLNDLRKIKYPKEFKRKYPDLFDQFDWVKKGIILINKLKEVKDDRKKKAILLEFIKNWGGTEKEWLDYSEDFSLEKYVNDIADMYTIYFNNLSDVLKMIKTTPIYFTKSCNIDENKLALLTAFCCLTYAKTDLEDKQKYLYYVASYVKDYKDKQKGETLRVINVLKKNMTQRETISYEYISREFSDLLIDNPELNFIDFSRDYFSGMTTEEIDLYMKDYLNDVRLNWDFLPPDDETVSKETFKLIQEEGKKHKEIDEEAFKQKLIDLFMEKKSFFDSSNPFCILKGKGAFSGYVGYCYSNGKIILDKYYENDKKKKLAFGEAIYVMDLFNFYALSRMSKKQLISGNMCKRYYHRGDWKERVKQEISQGIAMQKSELNKRVTKLKDIEE